MDKEMASNQKYTETPISSHSLTGMELWEQSEKVDDEIQWID